jgi:hypothetical protein
VPSDLLSSLESFHRHGLVPYVAGRRTIRGTASISRRLRSISSAPPVRSCLSFTTPAGPYLISRAREGVPGGLSLCVTGNCSPVPGPAESLRTHRIGVNSPRLPCSAPGDGIANRRKCHCFNLLGKAEALRRSCQPEPVSPSVVEGQLSGSPAAFTTSRRNLRFPLCITYDPGET